MLVWGTANPEGVVDTDGGCGAYFSDSDIRKATSDLIDKKVLCEHSGSSIGRVLSAWEYEGCLHCIFFVDTSLNGRVARRFIKDGVCSELSLGYLMNMCMSSNVPNRVVCGDKEVTELSIVVKGARHRCNIHAYVE
jgi:hypothetical protein